MTISSLGSPHRPYNPFSSARPEPLPPAATPYPWTQPPQTTNPPARPHAPDPMPSVFGRLKASLANLLLEDSDEPLWPERPIGLAQMKRPTQA